MHVGVWVLWLGSQLDHVINTKDGYGSFGSKLEALDLANGRLQHSCLLAVTDTTINKLQTIPE